MQRSRVYLDAGGSQPLSRRVADALAAGIADGWADPTRLSTESRRSRALLEGSREAIADVLGTRPEHIHFLPSPHLAFERVIAGIVAARRGSDRIIVGATERDALMDAAHAAVGDAVETIPVDIHGHVDADALEAAVGVPGVALAAVQHANQEIGTIQRLDRIADITASAAVPLLVDATASIGHIDPPSRWDALVGHAADWGGPAGIAFIATTPRTRWLPVWAGRDGFSPGGVNVALALAAAVALQEREELRSETDARLRRLVDTVRDGVSTLDGIDLVGDPRERLPHVVTFSCLYADGETLVSELDRVGFAIGSGSACATGTLEPSRVLAAVGALTHGNVRLSLPPTVTAADIDAFLMELPPALQRIRSRLGAPPAGS
jgi:cysteine desulfurase